MVKKNNIKLPKKYTIICAVAVMLLATIGVISAVLWQRDMQAQAEVTCITEFADTLVGLSDKEAASRVAQADGVFRYVSLDIDDTQQAISSRWSAYDLTGHTESGVVQKVDTRVESQKGVERMKDSYSLFVPNACRDIDT